MASTENLELSDISSNASPDTSNPVSNPTYDVKVKDSNGAKRKKYATNDDDDDDGAHDTVPKTWRVISQLLMIICTVLLVVLVVFIVLYVREQSSAGKKDPIVVGQESTSASHQTTPVKTSSSITQYKSTEITSTNSLHTTDEQEPYNITATTTASDFDTNIPTEYTTITNEYTEVMTTGQPTTAEKYKKTTTTEGLTETTTLAPDFSTPPVSIMQGNSTLRLNVPPGEFQRFHLNVTSLSDVTLSLIPASDNSGNVLVAIYGKREGEPTHVVYDVVQTIAVSRLRRSTSNSNVWAVTFKSLIPGQWDFAVYNDGPIKFQGNLTLESKSSEVPCLRDCFGKGICQNGVCYCDEGWHGKDCSLADPVPCIPKNCSGHGVYDGLMCLCLPGWSGEECETAVCVFSDCNNHGLCVNATCICVRGWKGAGCNEADCIPSDCNGNGICFNATCVCDKDHQGNSCSLPFNPCPSDCSNNGICDTTVGVCTCSQGWTLADCSERTCSVCSNNGNCQNGTCECNDGWTGDGCSEVACALECDIHGYCQQGVCICDFGWKGIDCKEVACRNNCSNQGSCVKEDDNWRCICIDGFQGEACQIGSEMYCGNGIDDDLDTLVDCEDPDCCNQTVCGSSALCSVGNTSTEIAQKNISDAIETETYFEQIRFLFDSLIQQETNMSIIDPNRVTVIRGKVFTRETTPLPGVTVSMLNDEAFGFTMSKSDGSYDFVLNGGDLVTLKFDRPKFIQSQRAVLTVVNSFITAPDIVMIPLDIKVTTVNLTSSEVQLVESSQVKDESGSRHGALMFFPGTKAIMNSKNFTTNEVLETPAIRVTEYTVGSSGPEAMPAQLPSFTGYTHAVEMSVDEASNNDSVVFTQPLAYYVENYLGFPVGSAVPAGFYNKTLGEWIAAENGRVVIVLNSSSPITAQLDVTGKGVPATEEEKADLSMD